MHELGHSIFGFSDVSVAAGINGATLPPEFNFRTKTIMSYETLPGHLVGEEAQGTRALIEMFPTTPMVLDIRAAQAIYGPNLDHETDDTVYRFEGAELYHETIWDAGGVDTIAVSGTAPVEIDLRPGHYSNFGASLQVQHVGPPDFLSQNVGIAQEVIIENADGGLSHDNIIGNDAGNRLRGGPGDDVLVGGPGPDVLHGDGLDLSRPTSLKVETSDNCALVAARAL
jgi:hypothetical protein